MKTVKIFCTLTLLLLLSYVPNTIIAQNFDAGKYYRLTTQWQGDNKSLDVANEGQKDKVHLYTTGNYAGQYWKITSLGNGHFRLTTQWQGDGKSLDVVNNKVALAATGNTSSQAWKITALGNGFYRLTNQGLGEGKSLDVINDGKNNQLQLANTGNLSGQFWKITEVPGQSAAPAALEMGCAGSKNGAKIAFVSKQNQTIQCKVNWDEGATFSKNNMIIANGVCESCPNLGGVDKKMPREGTYTIKQTDPSLPVTIKWNGKFCGEDRSLVIPN